MKEDLPWFRRIQKKAIAATNAVSTHVDSAVVVAGRALEIVDKKIGITVQIRAVGQRAEEMAQTADQDGRLSDTVRQATSFVNSTAAQAKESALQVANEIGLKERTEVAIGAITTLVREPIAKAMEKSKLDDAAKVAGRKAEEAYGRIRGVVKPYFPPANGRELLLSTKRELAYISACIMQISPSDAEKLASQFGTAIASKMAGVATTGVLLALVNTFGTASTGTAIASLSGAAAANATLAWIGGLVGGGMAAGAALTGGLTVVVGLAAYKALGSERRPFDTLPEHEQRIVQACWLLIAAIDELLAGRPHPLKRETAIELLDNSLLPLRTLLIEQGSAICANLDAKNAIAFRQHVLTDFDRTVIAGFRHFIEEKNVHWDTAASFDYEEYVVGGVFYALMTRTAIDDSTESQLVLAALRRSDKSLAQANEAQLTDYLNEYDAEQLKGVASNVKGIYHEELWVHRYNESHTNSSAQMFGQTNHPGADIQIRDARTGEVIDEFQLKATDSTAYINHHLERYPDIKVLATDEVANRMGEVNGVHSSGISNAKITGKVDHDIAAVTDNTLGHRVEQSAEYALLVSSGRGLIDMLQGRQAFPQAAMQAAKRVGVASAATALTAYLFS